jgi:hypothetical protein
MHLRPKFPYLQILMIDLEAATRIHSLGMPTLYRFTFPPSDISLRDGVPVLICPRAVMFKKQSVDELVVTSHREGQGLALEKLRLPKASVVLRELEPLRPACLRQG